MAASKHGFISFHDTEPKEKLQEIARKELGETEESKEKCLQELRILMRERNVTCISTDDFLLRFLRTNKFNTRRSFGTLQNYAQQRRTLHKGLLELRPEVLETCIRLNIIGFLPYRDAEGRRIYFYRIGNWKPSICPRDELLTMCLLVASHSAETETAQITGTASIYDFESASVTLLLYIGPLINRWKNFIFNCLPARYSATHVLSNSAFLKYLYPLISPFVPKKVAERIVFHEENAGSLFEDIPASILPDVFGGTLGSLDTDSIAQTLVEYLKKLKDEYQYFQEDI